MRLNPIGPAESHSHPNRIDMLQYILPLVIYIALALQVPRVAGPDLSPWPDAPEYALITDRLIHLQAPLIGIGPHEYPPRYPLIYPLLAAMPAKLIEWFTPATQSYLTHFYWITLAYGALSVLLMARVGGWFTQRPAGGFLAAALWATHPALLGWSAVVMSETALLSLWLLMLECLQPWLSAQPTPSTRNWVRAGLAGLLASALTIAKVPFIFWAVFPTLVLLVQARKSRHWQTLAAFVFAGLGLAVAELIYRRWAFGTPWENGYFFWLPDTRARGRMFAGYFLFHNDLGRGEGNLEFFAKQLLGIHHGFYAWSFVGLTIAAGVILIKRRRQRSFLSRIRLSKLNLAMLGWVGCGLCFCLFYYAQYDRLFLLWIPAIDLLCASLLCAAFSPWVRSSNSSAAWRRLTLAALMIAIGFHQLFQYQQAELNIAPSLNTPRTPRFAELLSDVPPGAWLFTNLDLPLVQRLRPQPGPCGTIYAREVSERYLSGHTAQIIKYQLPPHHTGGANQLQVAEKVWQGEFPCLINASNAWQPAPGTEQQLGADVYLFVIRPRHYMNVRRYLDQTAWPLLSAHGQLVPVRSSADMTLYRLHWSTTP